MIEGEERGRLDGVPENLQPKARPRDKERKQGGAPPPPPPLSGQPGQASGSFALNNPTIISLLYLAGFMTIITSIVGLVLAFVWKDEPHEAWEDSHYQYLINTFWIGLAGSIIGFILMFAFIGFLIFPAIAVLFIVRSVMSLINAQKQEPMPNPGSWLV
ncbi:MAG: hypothetical protein R3D89_08755 [Sphingomonadaceae bacterium]|jgi:uncharacterized membrane protein